MTVYQTKRAIRALRLAAKSGPLPMALHDLITKSLIDLIRHRDLLLDPSGKAE
jgi:hypothetical protein